MGPGSYKIVTAVKEGANDEVTVEQDAKNGTLMMKVPYPRAQDRVQKHRCFFYIGVLGFHPYKEIELHPLPDGKWPGVSFE
jgi:hypothetical protein